MYRWVYDDNERSPVLGVDDLLSRHVCERLGNVDGQSHMCQLPSWNHHHHEQSIQVRVTRVLSS